jgi:sugar lactone lactonase YvrE
VKVEVAAREDDVLGETPAWDMQSGHLFWVDLRRQRVQRLDLASGRVAHWPMPEVATAVVPRRSGGLIVALKRGLHAFDPRSGALTLLVTVENDGPIENRLNDAKCDPAGRLWCGSMFDYGREVTGSLYRIDRDLGVQRIRSGITIPNSIAFAPDGRTIYFADTAVGRIDCAACDPEAGVVGPWRAFADQAIAPGKPDGTAVDAEGCLWNARYGGGCVVRIAPNGRLDRVISLPVSQPTSCTFGGADLATLFITTATQRLSEAQRQAEPLAGALLAVDVGIAGLPERAFAG